MLLNAGEFHNEMTKQSMELEMPVLGSSANTSLTGSKYNLDDIDLPVIKEANILIDGGTSKYKNENGQDPDVYVTKLEKIQFQLVNVHKSKMDDTVRLIIIINPNLVIEKCRKILREK